MQVGRHQGMMANKHITRGSNVFENVKTFQDCKFLKNYLHYYFKIIITSYISTDLLKYY